MRIVVLGGTRFIGRALVEDLVGAGHGVQVVHRGETEPEDLPPVEHLHLHRSELPEQRDHLRANRPDAAVDCRAMTRADARSALAAFPSGLRLVVLSSMDVYRAYGSLRAGLQTDPVPLDETAPVRQDRYPYRGEDPDIPDYEKLDVEEEYLAAGATILRLPMVYGEHDYQRREEFILRRVRAGRSRIPVGPGTWLSCWGYVREIARGVRLALESDRAAGQVINLAQVPTWPVRLWAERILAASGSDAELVRVSEEALPDDLGITRSQTQHLLTDPRKARELLGWVHADPEDGLRASVAWHLANPPPDHDPDFAQDDLALGSTEVRSG
jgi:nucleoside-diphosphate-sugar epimerase